MTLTTHAIVGAAVGAVAANNLPLAAVAAFASHLLIDAIPHWDYYLASAHDDVENPMNNDMDVSGKAFIIDLIKIGIDVLFAAICVFLLFRSASPVIFTGAVVGAIFGVLPDPLQFVYYKMRTNPLILPLQRLHMFIATKIRLNKMKAPWPAIGVLSQTILVLLTILFIKHFFP